MVFSGGVVTTRTAWLTVSIGTGFWYIGMGIGYVCLGCSPCECMSAGCVSLVKWEKSNLCICHIDLLCRVVRYS